MNDKYLLNSRNGTKKIVTDKKHENHPLIDLDDAIKKFECIDKLINLIEEKMEFFDFDKNEAEQVQNTFTATKSVMENYQTYKCYNLYQSIINAEKFLYSNFGGKTEKNYSRLIIITSGKEFNKNIISFSNKLKSINRKESKSPIDFSLFKNKKFENLTELILIKDKCNDISPLFSCEFP